MLKIASVKPKNLYIGLELKNPINDAYHKSLLNVLIDLYKSRINKKYGNNKNVLNEIEKEYNNYYGGIYIDNCKSLQTCLNLFFEILTDFIDYINNCSNRLIKYIH